MPTKKAREADPVVTSRCRAPRTGAEDRRRQLLDTAEALLATGGSDALRMDHVARAAGVTRPVVYGHFTNRDGLVVALLERHSQRLSEHEALATVGATSFDEYLRNATRAYLSAAFVHGPALRALVAGEHLSPAIESARSRIWGKAASTWAKRYRTHYDLSATDANALAVSHLAALSALAGSCIDGRLEPGRAVDLHVTSTLAALDAISGRARTLG